MIKALGVSLMLLGFGCGAQRAGHRPNRDPAERRFDERSAVEFVRNHIRKKRHYRDAVAASAEAAFEKGDWWVRLRKSGDAQSYYLFEVNGRTGEVTELPVTE